MNFYTTATHDVFQDMIGMKYVYPLPNAWDYASVCNAAIQSGFEIVVMFHDRVVYRHFDAIQT